MRKQLYSKRRLHLCFFLPLVSALFCLLLVTAVLLSHNAGGFFYILSVLAAALVLFSCVNSILFYRRTFIRSSQQMKQICEQFSLILPEEKTLTYDELLHYILDTVYHTLDQAYSSQLLRKQAEFDRMKSQINPHFLYNTLDSIRGYALAENSPVTADMIEVLSRIFRYTISQKNELIALEKELSMLSDYITIQEYRCNSHILLQKQIIDPQLYQYPIPKLILQPFIENAIKYAMQDRSNFIITVRAETTQSRLILTVADNGCGITADDLAHLNERLYRNEYGQTGSGIASKKGSGIAITNVNARLKLLFGDEYGVNAFSTLGLGSEFRLVLPYHPELLTQQEGALSHDS